MLASISRHQSCRRPDNMSVRRSVRPCDFIKQLDRPPTENLEKPLRAVYLADTAHESSFESHYSGADKFLAIPGRRKLHFPHFMELRGSLPHSQQSTTSPYPSQINPFLCPSHFWQAQLVSFLVGLWTYQHRGNVAASSHVTWSCTSVWCTV